MVAKAGEAIRTAWPVAVVDSQSPSTAFGLPLLDTAFSNFSDFADVCIGRR